MYKLLNFPHNNDSTITNEILISSLHQQSLQLIKENQNLRAAMQSLQSKHKKSKPTATAIPTTMTFEAHWKRPIKHKKSTQWLESMVNCICCNNLRWWCRGCSDKKQLESLLLVGFSEDKQKKFMNIEKANVWLIMFHVFTVTDLVKSKQMKNTLFQVMVWFLISGWTFIFTQILHK